MDSDRPSSSSRALVGVGLVCALGGCVIGFVLGGLATKVGWKILTGSLESAAPADVTRPALITRPAFSLSHPGNWTIDTQDEDYDPDAYFDINAPAQGKIIFRVGPPAIGSPESVDGTISAMTERLVQNATLTSYTTWGSYSGHGLEARGKILVTHGRVRAFGWSTDAVGVLVTEIRYDEDEVLNKPGYDLIESSFRLAK